MEKVRLTAELKNKKTNEMSKKTFGHFSLEKKEIEKAIDLAIYKSKHSEYLVKSLMVGDTIIWLNRDFC